MSDDDEQHIPARVRLTEEGVEQLAGELQRDPRTGPLGRLCATLDASGVAPRVVDPLRALLAELQALDDDQLDDLFVVYTEWVQAEAVRSSSRRRAARRQAGQEFVGAVVEFGAAAPADRAGAAGLEGARPGPTDRGDEPTTPEKRGGS